MAAPSSFLPPSLVLHLPLCCHKFMPFLNYLQFQKTDNLSYFLIRITEQLHIDQTVEGRCCQHETASPVPLTGGLQQGTPWSMAPSSLWGSEQCWVTLRKISAGQTQKLFPAAWLLERSHTEERSMPKEDLTSKRSAPGEPVGLPLASTEVPGISQPHPCKAGAKKCPPCPHTAVTCWAAGARTSHQLQLSPGIGTAKLLEAMAEKNEKWAFVLPDSLPFQLGTLTGLCSNVLAHLHYCWSGNERKPQTDFKLTT